MIVTGNLQMCYNSTTGLPPFICGVYGVYTYEIISSYSVTSCSELKSLRTTGYGVCLPTSCGCAVDWIATSDKRVKENITPISNALSTVNSLCGVYYNLCCSNQPRSIGFIAQDVLPNLPEVVSQDEPTDDDKKFGITDVKYGIKYNKITAVLVEAIKEQQKQIDELRKEVEILKSNISNV